MSEIPRKLSAIFCRFRDSLEPERRELGAAVRSTIRPIAERHIREVRSGIGAAASLDDEAVLDDLPEVLASLAQAYMEPERLEAFSLCGPAHASARDGQNFSLADVFTEYSLLRRSLREHVIAALRRPLEDAEEIALHLGVDALVAETVESFSAIRDARVRLESTALSDFLNSLAHDLRNEISGVMNSLLLLEEITNESVANATAMIDTVSFDRMRELARDFGDCRATMESSVQAMTRMLEVQRLRTAVVLRPRPTALLPLMQGIVRSVGRSARNPKYAQSREATELIRITCPTDLVVNIDPDLLSTALVNLLGNAVKHAPGGEIFFSAFSLHRGRFRVEIRDRGPGIAPEHLAGLFRRFARGASAADGAGLGLFIAQRAAELLGSRVEVASVVGDGSCFSMELAPMPGTDAQGLS